MAPASVRLAVILTLSLLGLPIGTRAQDGPSLRGDNPAQGLVQSSAPSESIAYDEAPVPVKKVRPIYPDVARNAQITGKVILLVLVDTDGRARNIKVTRGILGGLNEAAVDCVRQWVFRPALRNNKPVAAWIQVPISLPVDGCPPEVLEGGRARVVARVGERFFAECITLDSAGFFLVPDWIGRSKVYFWSLAYSLKIPKKPWVRGTIRVEVDTTGVLAHRQGIEGIGDCVHNPKECAFSVDERTARAIAKRGGLKPGLKPWRTEFRWETGPRPCYAWIVANTLRSDGLGGDLAIIDANTGEILELGPWLITKIECETRSAPRDTTGAGKH